MISATGRYALRILGYLAGRQGTWVQARQMASDTGIPGNYLSKILNQLGKQGIVSSRRGWGGGFTLRREGLDRPLAAVVELFDGRRPDGECLFGMERCDAAMPCPLHHWWERARGSYDEMLRTVRVRDLQPTPREARP